MVDKKDVWVVIPAAGKGNRFHETQSKQHHTILGKTILEHTLSLFLDKPWVKGIVVVLPKGDRFSNPNVKVVEGGETRAQSVYNALLAIKAKTKANDWVLVHDAVRACLHVEDLAKVVAAREGVGVILASRVCDTLKKQEGEEVATVDRDNLWAAQTPQIFNYDLLKNALLMTLKMHPTDEAQAIETMGFSPKIVEADFPNPKLTYQRDSAWVTWLLQTCE